MSKLYVLFRHDTQQWYHSLTPKGYLVWVDRLSEAQWMTEEEADRIKDMWNENPYKHVLEVAPICGEEDDNS